MSGDFAADLSTGDPEKLALADEIAALLLTADASTAGTASSAGTASTARAAAAERELAERYAADPRLQPGERVTCHSPTGEEFAVDPRKRESARIASRAEIAVGGLRV